MLTIVRLIPLPIHAALRLASGLLTMALPFLVGFTDPGAIVLAVLVGALTAGVALSGLPDERGRPGVGVGTLHALDYGLALGSLGIALAVALAGDGRAGAALCAVALVQLAGNALTRYTARG